MKIAKGIKIGILERKSGHASPQRLEPKNVMRQRGQISLSYYTNTKGKSKGTTSNKGGTWGKKPPNVGNKKGGVMPPRQIMLVSWTECRKVVLCYQGKLQLCCERNVRRWSYDTKTNHISAADWMSKIALGCKDKSCRCRQLNVRRWFCGQG
jgi:hypothetical protein